MYMHYVYIDGLWVVCRNQTEVLVVVGQGGRQEPYGFVPESGSLEMRFDVWLRNLVRTSIK